jgi:hypothetical protein
MKAGQCTATQEQQHNVCCTSGTSLLLLLHLLLLHLLLLHLLLLLLLLLNPTAKTGVFSGMLKAHDCQTAATAQQLRAPTCTHLMRTTSAAAAAAAAAAETSRHRCYIPTAASPHLH